MFYYHSQIRTEYIHPTALCTFTAQQWATSLKIASQMPKPHSLQALQKHHEIVPLGSQNIKSVAMAILLRRLKLKVNKL